MTEPGPAAGFPWNGLRLAARVVLAAESREALRLLARLLRPHCLMVLAGVGVTIAAGLCEAGTTTILPVALQLLANREAGAWVAEVTPWFGWLLRRPADRQDVFFALLALAAALLLLRSSGLLISGVVGARLRTVVETSLRRALFRAIMGMRFGPLARYKSGELLTYFQLAGQAGEACFHANDLCAQACLALGMLGVLFYISWSMTLLAVGSLLLLVWPLHLIMDIIRRTARDRQDALRGVNETALEYVQAVRLVRTQAREDYVTERFEDLVERSERAERRGLVWPVALNPLLDAATILGVVGFLAVGIGVLGAPGERRALLVQLLAFVFVLHRLTPRILVVQNRQASVAAAWPAVCRLTEFLRQAVPEAPGGPRQPPVPFAVLEFQGVSLRYDGEEREAVADLSFAVRRGQTVALVGESGGGKSSVIDLVLGLYEPTAGRIVLDGADLAEFDRKAWRRTLGIVGQDTAIFNTTIRDNIAFGHPEATEAEIVAAARRANAHNFIVQTARGYDTIVGDRGARLSGGQRQRIAIARAILRGCRFLILDEATSNLDSQSERVILQGLQDLGRECTVLVVAHRLSTVQGADLIIVVDQGRLVEQGRHEELLARQGYYARLWRLQSGREPDATSGGPAGAAA